MRIDDQEVQSSCILLACERRAVDRLQIGKMVLVEVANKSLDKGLDLTYVRGRAQQEDLVDLLEDVLTEVGRLH